MELPRLEDLPLKQGQRVLVRVDLNVPLRDGVVEDDLRISTALPTIQWLREQHAVVVVAGHLGRPKGVVDPQYSMAPVARRLSELLGCEVLLAPAVVGPRVEPLIASSSPGDVVMVENLRFEPGETTDDPAFCTNLSELGDLYVNEAFGASHRAHASIVGPPRVLPHAGGRLLHREVEVLSKLLADDVGPPVRRRARRRQGRRQARGDRRAARPLRQGAHRRRDGVHVPARPGRRASATRSCSPRWSTSAPDCSPPAGSRSRPTS